MSSPLFLHPRLIEAPPECREVYDRSTDSQKATIHGFLDAVDGMIQATERVQASFVDLVSIMDSSDPEDIRVGTEGVTGALGELEGARAGWLKAVEEMKTLPDDLKDAFSGFLGLVQEALRSIQIQG
ncbi:MAG: hypothetical protein VKP72_02560 [bacterium]|nr:hypothetical protein [bacterium]